MKAIKRVISLVLTATFLLSLCAMPAMAEQKKYSFFGDSMTYNFVRKNHYHDPITTFPAQVAEEMGFDASLMAYVGDPARSGEMEMGAIPGGRYTDLYTFISDYEGDEYFRKNYGDYYKGRVQYYMSVAEDSDVLSIKMGYSAVNRQMLSNITSYLGGKEQQYSTDLSQLTSGEELSKILPIAALMRDTIDKLVPDSTKNALAQYAASLSEDQQKALNNMFGEETVDALKDATDLISVIADNFAYFLASHIIHFDLTIERLYELNPDLELYIMGLDNPMQYLKLSFTVENHEYYIPIGDMSSAFFELLNTYMKVLSPNSTRYYFVDNVKHAHTYGDAMAESVDLTRDVLYSIYNDENWEGHEDTLSEAYKKADAHAYGVNKALNNIRTIDLNRLLAELPDDLGSLSLDGSIECLDCLTEIDEHDELKATYIEQLQGTIFMIGALGGLYVHPDQAGHDAQAEVLVAAMKNPTVAPAAVAYHKLAQPLDEAVSELRKCTSPSQFADWVENLPQKVNEQKKQLNIATPVIKEYAKKTTFSAITAGIKQTVEKIEKGIKDVVANIKTITTPKITPIIPQISIFKKR